MRAKKNTQGILTVKVVRKVRRYTEICSLKPRPTKYPKPYADIMRMLCGVLLCGIYEMITTSMGCQSSNVINEVEELTDAVNHNEISLIQTCHIGFEKPATE